MESFAIEVLPGLVIVLLFLLQIRQGRQTAKMCRRVRDLQKKIRAIERAMDLRDARQRLGIDDG